MLLKIYSYVIEKYVIEKIYVIEKNVIEKICH